MASHVRLKLYTPGANYSERPRMSCGRLKTPERQRFPPRSLGFFPFSSQKEEKAGERRPFGTPLSGSLPARASRRERVARIGTVPAATGRAGLRHGSVEYRQELPKSIAPEILSINTPQARPAKVASFKRNLKS